MSFLTLAEGLPDFSKAVISFWFRVPKASIDAVSNAAGGPLLQGIIPLVVMGKSGTANTQSTSTTQSFLGYVNTGWDVTGSSYAETTAILGPCPEHGSGSVHCSVTASYNPSASFVPTEDMTYLDVGVVSPDGPGDPTNPTCIGVYCWGNVPTLYINFETSQKPSVSGYDFNESLVPGSVQATAGGAKTFTQGSVIQTGCSFPAGPPLPIFDVVTTDTTTIVSSPPGSTTGDPHSSYVDISDILVSATGAITGSSALTITPDHWHHVLVAVDLQSVQTHGASDPHEDLPLVAHIDHASKLFVALDDVNYTGWDLSDYWSEGDPNDVVTSGAYEVANQNAYTDQNGAPLATAQYLLADMTVPCHGNPIGLPGTSQVVDTIYGVEMAEFQMWAGLSLDTKDEGNRRAFIDAAGKPVPPFKKSGSVELLGRVPDILLNGSGNWIAGRNTGGVAKLNEIGKPITVPAENLTPTGLIVSYSPDPSLHGLQSPPPPPRQPAPHAALG